MNIEKQPKRVVKHRLRNRIEEVLLLCYNTFYFIERHMTFM